MNPSDLFRRTDINRGVEAYRAEADALLLDVRTPEEFREGRIPGSTNLPLLELDAIFSLAENQDTPLFLYCHSGARSGQAAYELQSLGYTNVKNIGGIAAYTGILER